jgi:Putative binding domain, N-terminal/Viral BACON domain
MSYRCRCLLAVVPVVAAILVGCETSSSVTTDPTPAKCQLVVTTPAVLDAAGGTSTFNVTAQPECAWETASRADWISEVSPASAQGSAEVRFRVAPNTGTASRDGEILVSGEHVRVSQRAACRFDLSPASQTVAANGGEGSVTVTTAADCPWTATADAGWITLTGPATGTGNGTIRFAIAENGTNERGGSIVVGGARATVIQAGLAPPPPPPPPPCNATVVPATQNIGAAGGAAASINVTAPAPCAWTAVSNASWIAVTTGATGKGAGTVALTVAGNTGAARTGTVTIAGQAATVTQAACSYTTTPATQNVGVSGGAGTPITVATLNTCQWAASSNVTWITVATGRGTGPGSVAFTVAANTGQVRTGTLTVAGQTATVLQDAPCAYGLSPTDQTFSASAGNGTINVTAGNGCQWTSRSNAAWITIQSGLSGVGISRVTYSIEANTGPLRTGTITIADQTFTVTQQAAAGRITAAGQRSW